MITWLGSLGRAERCEASTSDVKFVACRVFLILPLRASELLGLVALSMSLRLWIFGVLNQLALETCSPSTTTAASGER